PSVGVVSSLLLLFYFPALLIGMTIVAIRASDLVARETGAKDPSFIVADEWAGQWIALTPLVFNALVTTSLTGFFIRVAVPFLFFRLFDIWKPWPAKQLQEIPGGPGIVLDDVAAGIYAGVLTFFIDPLIVSHTSIM
ncbi:MAG TPA: phosphatidylglycerophosphatase A, partial [Holophagaceae bacterium]|nr:phosphatidylglycerophosphatase A [Holophagaceae bacterium]